MEGRLWWDKLNAEMLSKGSYYNVIQVGPMRNTSLLIPIFRTYKTTAGKTVKFCSEGFFSTWSKERRNFQD